MLGANRFQPVKDVPELIAQTVGAGTSPQMWLSQPGEREAEWYPIGEADRAKALPAVRDEYGRSCVFQEQRAREVLEESLDRLKHLLTARLIAQGSGLKEAAAQAEYLLGKED